MGQSTEAAGQTRRGVLSTGTIANDFTQALKKTPGAVLQAVASRSQESADKFAAEHGFSKAYASYDDLAADGAVDIVYIATPHNMHHDNIMMCLDAGKHVLCEKPMTVNGKQAEECAQKAKAKGLFLMEGVWTRFFPTTRAVRKLVKEGVIGNVVSMHASFGFKAEPDFNPRLFQPELAGGALLDVGIYPVTWICDMLGVPSKVTAHSRLYKTGVDEQTFATFEFGGGEAMAQMQCGFNGALANEVVIVGSTGVLRVTRPIQCPETYHLLTRQGDESDPLLVRGVNTTVTTPLDPPNMATAPGFNFLGSQGFRFEIEAVQKALSDGLEEHPEMPLRETVAIAKLMDEMRRQMGVKYPWDEQ